MLSHGLPSLYSASSFEAPSYVPVTNRVAENIEMNKTDNSFLCSWGKTDNKPNKQGLLVMEKNKVGKELWSTGAGVGN